jgi:hypothetical protein
MFTPIETTIGAVLLHQATSNLLYQNGTILGLSGFLRRAMSAPTVETLTFFTGMLASYLPLKLLVPEMVTKYPSTPITLQVALFTTGVAALVGWGSKVCDQSIQLEVRD